MASRNHWVSCALITSCLLLPVYTSAAIFSVDYYQRLAGSGTTGILGVDYLLAGSGTFEIADSAITPNNTILFTSPDFLDFEITLSTGLGNAFFSKQISEYPGNYNRNRGLEQGILLDANAKPVRFDTPSTSISNTSVFCNPDCDIIGSSRDVFYMPDDDTYDLVLLLDGTNRVSSRSNAEGFGIPYTPFAGDWYLSPVGTINYARGIYTFSSVPVPEQLSGYSVPV